MKSILIYLISCFALTVFSGCSQNDKAIDELTETEDSLMGTLELTAVYDGSDQDNPWDPPAISRQIVFGQNGTFQDSRYDNCPATYTFDEELIGVDYSCQTERLIFGYRFEDGNLILSPVPTASSSCDEGCSDRYSRVQ